MNHRKSFTITDAVRLDMNLHGGRFIIAEFVIASIIVAGVVVASAIHYFTSAFSLFGLLWILSFLGVFFNCLVIVMLAISIRRNEGNRPAIVGKANPKTIAILFTIYIVIPYLLSSMNCLQRKKM